jgi:hypothetical protein
VQFAARLESESMRPAARRAARARCIHAFRCADTELSIDGLPNLIVLADRHLSAAAMAVKTGSSRFLPSAAARSDRWKSS